MALPSSNRESARTRQRGYEPGSRSQRAQAGEFESGDGPDARKCQRARQAASGSPTARRADLGWDGSSIAVRSQTTLWRRLVQRQGQGSIKARSNLIELGDEIVVIAA